MYNTTINFRRNVNVMGKAKEEKMLNVHKLNVYWVYSAYNYLHNSLWQCVTLMKQFAAMSHAADEWKTKC